MEITEFGHLIIDEFGVYLRKKRKRILIIHENNKKEISAKNIKEIVIMGKALISSELIKFLCQQGIDILFSSPTGKPLARVVSTRLGGTMENRVEQYKSLYDDRGITIAKQVIVGKIKNQMSNMRYYSKSRRATKDVALDLYDRYKILKERAESLENEEFNNLEEARKKIFAYEGECSGIYWQGMSIILKNWDFTGRKRKSDDAVNICLNICYNMLSSQIWKYILRFGLDPFAGYLHVERPGKLSLVYDLMEPFRPMVDRFLVSFLKGFKKIHFEKKRSVFIETLRRNFFSKFMNSKLEYKSRKMRIETVMFYYIQDVVSYLRRNKEKITTPFLAW